LKKSPRKLKEEDRKVMWAKKDSHQALSGKKQIWHFQREYLVSDGPNYPVAGGKSNGPLAEADTWQKRLLETLDWRGLSGRLVVRNL